MEPVTCSVFSSRPTPPPVLERASCLLLSIRLQCLVSWPTRHYLTYTRPKPYLVMATSTAGAPHNPPAALRSRQCPRKASSGPVPPGCDICLRPMNVGSFSSTLKRAYLTWNGLNPVRQELSPRTLLSDGGLTSNWSRPNSLLPVGQPNVDAAPVSIARWDTPALATCA